MTGWIGVALWLAVPWLTVLGLGGYWLFQHPDLWPIAGWLFASSYGIAWIAAARLRRRGHGAFGGLPTVPLNPGLSAQSDAVAAKLEALIESLTPQAYPPTSLSSMLALAQRVVGEVAREFRPKAERAELDVPVPYLLAILERVSRDLRVLLAEQVPFSHLLTVDSALRYWRWKKRLEELGSVARIGRMLVNPIGGVLGELSGAFVGKAMSYPVAELEAWAVRTLARKVGYYAILLYSGQLVLDNRSEAQLTEASRADLANADRATAKTREPLRIVVTGQAQAGKSSVVNALFGEFRAATDVLPQAGELRVYRLADAGEGEALVFDSPGYQDVTAWLDEHWAVLRDTDLLLLVCSATAAAQAADVDFVRQWTARFDRDLTRRRPPRLTVLTRIDQLRPLRDWSPPYDLNQAMSAKAQSIRAATEHLAATLAVPVEQVVPVCLKPAAEYNVEALFASIAAVLPDSQRARYARILQALKRDEDWKLVMRQLGNTGRLLMKGANKILP